MTRRDRVIVLYPLLFAIYPTLALYSYNVSQTPLTDPLRVLLYSLGITAVLLVLFRFLFRDWHRAGLVCTLWILLFFSFGHAYKALLGVTIGGVWVGQANVLAAVWASILIIGTWAIIRVLRRPVEIGRILNVMSAAAILFSLVNIVSFAIRSAGSGSARSQAPAAAQERSQGTGQADAARVVSPDVYYIILDGYGRSDVLDEIYHEDNGEFINFLKEKGFFVAEQSTSNYNQTALTISSALNYHYLYDLVELDPESEDRAPTQRLVNNSAVMKYLRERGYTTVAFDTWYFVTQMKSADIYYPNRERLNPFEQMLLTNSLAVFWVDRLATVERWENYSQSFENLYNTVDLEVSGPKFVFAHMIIPHPPFVFDENGSMGSFMGTGEGTMFSGSREDYFKGYTSQLRYANKVFSRVVGHILEASKTPPVIIIQADHGPGAYLDWDHPEKSCVKERHSILSAFYFPDRQYEALPPDITPVNTFRVVLNHVFGEELPLEANRSYFSSVERPFKFIEVTGRVNEACDLDAWEAEP